MHLNVVVERKQSTLPRYVVVPAARVAAWRLTQTVVVETVLNGSLAGRRSLKRWDERNWFVELPERICRRLGIDVGDRVVLRLELASTALPTELAALLRSDVKAQRAWSALSTARQRMLREEVLAAARPATRVRRARCGLGLATA